MDNADDSKPPTPNAVAVVIDSNSKTVVEKAWYMPLLDVYISGCWPVTTYAKKEIDRSGFSILVVVSFQLVFLAIALASFITSYISLTTTPYLAPATDVVPKFCTVAPVSVTTSLYIDNKGNYESSPQSFNAGASTYKISTKGMRTTKSNYQIMMQTFQNQIQQINNLGVKRDVFWNYAMWSSLHLQYTLPGLNNGFARFGLSGDSLTIFGKAIFGTVAVASNKGVGVPISASAGTIQGSCAKDWTVSYNGGLLKVNVPPSSSSRGTSGISLACGNDQASVNNAASFSDLGRSFNIDVRSLMTVLTQNFLSINGFASLQSLRLINTVISCPYFQEYGKVLLTDPIEYKAAVDLYSGYGYYVDDEYPGMTPILCDTKEGVCILEVANTAYYPFFVNKGTYDSSSKKFSACLNIVGNPYTTSVFVTNCLNAIYENYNDGLIGLFSITDIDSNNPLKSNIMALGTNFHKWAKQQSTTDFALSQAAYQAMVLTFAAQYNEINNAGQMSNLWQIFTIQEPSQFRAGTDFVNQNIRVNPITKDQLQTAMNNMCTTIGKAAACSVMVLAYSDVVDEFQRYFGKDMNPSGAILAFDSTSTTMTTGVTPFYNPDAFTVLQGNPPANLTSNTMTCVQSASEAFQASAGIAFSNAQLVAVLTLTIVVLIIVSYSNRKFDQPGNTDRHLINNADKSQLNGLLIIELFNELKTNGYDNENFDVLISVMNSINGSTHNELKEMLESFKVMGEKKDTKKQKEEEDELEYASNSPRQSIKPMFKSGN